MEHSSFVVVWDKANVDRKYLKSAVPELADNFTFAGELLDKDSLAVRGNCLACKAVDVEDVTTSLKQTGWFEQGIWDPNTVQISPLETVHTSDLSQS